MDQTPLRVRMNIRDLIVSPTSALALEFKALSETLGYPIIFEPEWSMIWSEFEAQYPDSETFIPSIVGTVVPWCGAFHAWLERDENEEVVDKVLERLRARGGNLVLKLNTSREATRTSTKFDLKLGNFEIVLPTSKPLPTSASSAEAVFASDLLQLFDEGHQTAPSASVVTEEPEWDDVSAHSPVVQPVMTHPLIHGHEQDAESLPDIATIQRPEELTNKPPYWLIVRREETDLIRIEGSHGPTLLLLDTYLKKWCRGNADKVGRPPIVAITLAESPFGLGVLHDMLTLDMRPVKDGRADRQRREMNPTFILAFVENVLGYAPLHGIGSAGRVWEFKRTRAFK